MSIQIPPEEFRVVYQGKEIVTLKSLEEAKAYIQRRNLRTATIKKYEPRDLMTPNQIKEIEYYLKNCEQYNWLTDKKGII